MKSYPPILGSMGQNFREFSAHVFDKLDGSNLRWEWSKKKGWYKAGTRNRLFDESDFHFGSAVLLFRQSLAPTLSKIAAKERWEHLIVFTEFYGAQSFAGQHEPDDPKRLTLFDAAADKKGLFGPKDFRNLFEGKVDTPKYFGQWHWSRAFVQDVRAGRMPCTFEGVVGKAGSGHALVMAKAKTQMWIDKVHHHYGQEAGDRIIAS